MNQNRPVWRSFGVLFALGILALSSSTYAASPSESTSTITVRTSSSGEEYEGVSLAQDQSIALLPGAPPSPKVETAYQRYGYYLSGEQTFSEPTSRLKVHYEAKIAENSALEVDVRGSNAAQNWTAWETNVTSNAVVDFPIAVKRAQYRIRLLGSSTNGPVLRFIKLEPLPSPIRYQAQGSGIAPTFRVWATREGLVGYRTANGHVIRPRDRFVALPSWRNLSSKNGREYQVRITYKGRSAVAPVFDVGPWNTHDDYWNLNRERYQDLRRGWPQDHAAYFDGYNRGVAEKGRVTFPTAIDVGDGTWWDDLQITAGRAQVDVTFLWLGNGNASQDNSPTARTQLALPPAPNLPSPSPTEFPALSPTQVVTPSEVTGNPTAEPTATSVASPSPGQLPQPTPLLINTPQISK